MRAPSLVRPDMCLNIRTHTRTHEACNLFLRDETALKDVHAVWKRALMHTDVGAQLTKSKKHKGPGTATGWMSYRREPNSLKHSYFSIPTAPKKGSSWLSTKVSLYRMRETII